MDPADLLLGLTGNSSAALVPNSAVAIHGSEKRSVSITPADRKSGTGVLTFTLSDGVNDVTFDIDVQVGHQW